MVFSSCRKQLKRFIFIIFLACLFSIQVPIWKKTASNDSFRNDIPPTITDYEIAEMDWMQIPAIVNQNETFEIYFQNTTLELKLEYRPLLSPDFGVFVVDENGVAKEEPTPQIYTFKGTIVGDPKSRVVMTLSESWYGGIITTDNSNIHLTCLSQYTSKKQDANHCVIFNENDFDYSQIPTTGLTSDLIEKTKTSKNELTGEKLSLTKSIGNGEILQCRIALACAPTYLIANPIFWKERMVNVLNMAADYYQGNLDVMLTGAVVIGYTTGFGVSEVSSLLTEFRDRLKTTYFPDSRHIPRDLAYLFLDQPIYSEDLGVFVAGAAWKTFQLNTNKAYAIGQQPYDESDFSNSFLFAHETGHLFGGIHDKYDTYLWMGLWKDTLMFESHQTWHMCPMFSDGRYNSYKDNIGAINGNYGMRQYAEERLVGWDYKTLPEGKGVNIDLVDAPAIPGGHALHLDTIGYDDSGYDFFAYIASQTYVVGSNGEITVTGYFRQDDAFYGTLTSKRKSYLYILSEDTNSIIKKEKVLESSDSIDWHWVEKTITGLTVGQTVRIGVGRRDSWGTDWELMVEWSYFNAISEWNALTSPIGEFVHLSTAYHYAHGDGYHVDTIGGTQGGYHFFGVFHETLTTTALANDIKVDGYFRQDDVFDVYGLEQGRRKVLLYILDSSFDIIDSCEILNYTHLTSWHHRIITIKDLPIGTYYVAIGRPDNWGTEWGLTAEWVDVVAHRVSV